MAVEMNEDFLFWGDIETSGLKFAEDRILEVGFKLTDLDLKVLDEHKLTIFYADLDFVYDTTGEFVQKMHEDNGLWDDCKKSGHTVANAEEELVEYVKAMFEDYGIEERSLPLAGSSLALDRQFLDFWMPEFHGLFHYRSIDNSTIKELCRRYNPDLYGQLVESETDHRVFTCLEGSIKEFGFYKDNFLIEGGN